MSLLHIIKRVLALFMIMGFGFFKAQAALPIGVQAQSLGGAIRARSSNEAIFYNAAAMIKDRRIEAGVDYLQGMVLREHRLGASVMDSQSGAWALGLAYSGLIRNELASSHLAYLAMAMPIVTDMFSIGWSFSYCHDPALGPGPEENFFNMDAGFLANLPHGMAFALSVDHLLSPKGREKSMGLALASTFDLGAIVQEVPLSVSFDWLMNDVTSEAALDHSFGAGMQYLMFHLMPFRVGFKASVKENEKLLSLGTGILSRSFDLDALYQQDVMLGKNRFFGLALRVSL